MKSQRNVQSYFRAGGVAAYRKGKLPPVTADETEVAAECRAVRDLELVREQLQKFEMRQAEARHHQLWRRHDAYGLSWGR